MRFKRLGLSGGAIAAALAAVLTLLVAVRITDTSSPAVTGSRGAARRDRASSALASFDTLSGFDTRARAASPLRSVVEAEVSRDDTSSLRVAVADGNGMPLPEVLLRVRPAWALEAPCSSGPQTIESKTGPDGESELVLETWTTYVIEASKDGYASERTRSPPGEVSIILEKAGELTLRTFDGETGGGLAGVEVSLEREASRERWEYESGEDGFLQLKSVEAGRYALAIRAEDYLDHVLYDVIVEPEGGATHVDVPMYRGVVIEGVVIDSVTRAPLTEGFVEAHGARMVEERATIGPTGRFTLRGLPRANEVFEVTAPGYEPYFGYLHVIPCYDPRTGEQTRDAVIRVSPRTSLRGRVLADGAPVSGAVVTLGIPWLLSIVTSAHPSMSVGRLTRTVTAADGTFELASLTENLGRPHDDPDLSLLVLHPGYAPWFKCLELSDTNGELVINLDKGSRLVLSVSDEAGLPERAATVELLLRNPRRPDLDRGPVLDLIQPTPLTDDRGLAVVEHLCPGTWQLDVVSADGERSEHGTLEIAAASETELSIVLDGSHFLEGVVLDRTGQPVGGALVLWYDQPQRYTTRTDAAGEFRLRVPVVGRVKVGVAGETVPHMNFFEVVVGERTTLEVGTSRPTTPHLTEVTGVVLDASSGRRLALASFDRVVPTEDGSRIALYGSGDVPGGSFRLKLSDREGSTITFKAPGYRARQFGEPELVAVRSGVQVELERDSDEAQPCLRIHLPEGLLMPAVVLFDPQTKQEIARARYVRSTEYEFALEDRSAVLLMVTSLKGYMSSPLLCTASGPPEIEVELTSGAGRIHGRIRDGCTGAVYMRDPKGLCTRLETLSDRRFTTFLLAPGIYELWLGENPPIAVQVIEGERTEIELY
ncbi:MAG: carboxypeptidase-like regulatory domain-containing protein [Planctomycetota bacterium]